MLNVKVGSSLLLEKRVFIRHFSKKEAKSLTELYTEFTGIFTAYIDLSEFKLDMFFTDTNSYHHYDAKHYFDSKHYYGV